MKVILHMPTDEKNIKELEEKVSLIHTAKIVDYLEKSYTDCSDKEKVIDYIINDVYLDTDKCNATVSI